MTDKEAAKWIQLYIDIAKIDPLTGEAAYLNDDDRKMIEAMEMAINALTEQPETHEERTETHSCDLISKASVCEILADIYPTDGEKVVAVKEVDKAYEAIQHLPYAQPSSSCAHENDTISRQEAIDAMTNTLWHYPNECYRNLNEYEFAKGLAELGLKSVPPAQPEIIHCRECKYHIDGFFCQVANHHTSDKDCCASVFGAERRKDG